MFEITTKWRQRIRLILSIKKLQLFNRGYKSIFMLKGMLNFNDYCQWFCDQNLRINWFSKKSQIFFDLTISIYWIMYESSKDLRIIKMTLFIIMIDVYLCHFIRIKYYDDYDSYFLQNLLDLVDSRDSHFLMALLANWLHSKDRTSDFLWISF